MAHSEYDVERSGYLINIGIKILRFENKSVLENIDAVLEEIKSNMRTTPA